MVILKNITVVDIVSFWIAFSFISAVIISVFYIIRWWFSAMFAAWDQEKIKEAIHTIRYSVIWLIIVFFAVIFINIISWFLWVETSKFLNTKAISKTFDMIIDRATLSPEESDSDEEILDF